MAALLFGQSVSCKQPMSINAAGQVKDGEEAMVGMVTQDQIVMESKGKKSLLWTGRETWLMPEPAKNG
ncbi:MAG: hypothetical protein LH609_17700 [Rudanella sp.]|nr:hypothetical protein [Rudanella sp.]